MSTRSPEPVWTAAKAVTAVSSFVTGLLALGFVADLPYVAEAGAVILLACTVLAPIYGANVRGRVTAHENVASYKNSDGHLVSGPQGDVAYPGDPTPAELADFEDTEYPAEPTV